MPKFNEIGMDQIIDCKDLCFGYEDNLVLKNVSFSVKEGEFIGIIGPNGGGKTTLLKLLMGFIKPTSGFLTLFGAPPEKATCEIGYVPQSMRFDKQFPISVFELVLSGRLFNLPWYGSYSSEDRQIALQAIEDLQLAPLKDAAFGTLSGGQAQRALIARALVSKPKLLLLDEPTANVDARVEADIYSLLKELSHQMTILMVTHDLTAAINQVQRVFCIQHNLVDIPPQEVCEHFALGLYHQPLLNPGRHS